MLLVSKRDSIKIKKIRTESNKIYFQADGNDYFIMERHVEYESDYALYLKPKNKRVSLVKSTYVLNSFMSDFLPNYKSTMTNKQALPQFISQMIEKEFIHILG